MKGNYPKERKPGERREYETAALRKTTMLKTKTARRPAIGGVLEKRIGMRVRVTKMLGLGAEPLTMRPLASTCCFNPSRPNMRKSRD